MTKSKPNFFPLKSDKNGDAKTDLKLEGRKEESLLRIKERSN